MYRGGDSSMALPARMIHQFPVVRKDVEGREGGWVYEIYSITKTKILKYFKRRTGFIKSTRRNTWLFLFTI